MTKKKRKRIKDPILELARLVNDLYDSVIDLQKNVKQAWKKIIEIERKIRALEK